MKCLGKMSDLNLSLDPTEPISPGGIKNRSSFFFAALLESMADSITYLAESRHFLVCVGPQGYHRKRIMESGT